MLADRIEAKWIDAFCEIFERCAVKPGDTAAILSETQSRALNVHLAELALLRMGAQAVSRHGADAAQPADRADPLHRRQRGDPAAWRRWSRALQQAGFVVDCTIEGLMHAVETPEILKAGARILVISNEHPEALERMVPDPALEKRVRAAAKMLRGDQADARDLESRHRARRRHGRRLDGRRLGLDRQAGHAGALAGRHRRQLSQERHRQRHAGDGGGDINLTFKRYLTSPIRMTLKDDYVTELEGEGADAAMMRAYLAAWGDREAYAVSHVGFGMNPGARYEALTMYDQRDTNGTELRAVAGNFLFSTGANEFAGRYTAGHFDLPMMGTTIELDGVAVVREGVLQDVFG